MNSQSLEDTLVRYISQKYSLDKHTSERALDLGESLQNLFLEKLGILSQSGRPPPQKLSQKTKKRNICFAF